MPIPTHSVGKLAAYFKERCKLNWHQSLYSKVPDRMPELGVGPAKIGFPKEMLREWTKGARLAAAAWHWLRPEPAMTLQQLPALQAGAGLDHLPVEDFVQSLINACNGFRVDHSDLDTWIFKRMALLEFKLSSASRTPTGLDLYNLGVAVRQLNLFAASFGWQGLLDLALSLCDKSLKQSLIGAAQACSLVFGKHTGDQQIPITANLMVPARLTSPDGPGYTPTSQSVENAQTAAKLWNGQALSMERCLVVVAETGGDKRRQHTGFWVPIVRGAGQESIPGAPAAFDSLEGSAVFKDDLPPLNGFSPGLEKKWHNYLTDNLQERMFVSLPFVVQPAEMAPMSVAVLNINVDPPSGDMWHRAYHSEWLRVAKQAVAQFAESAYYALLIKSSFSQPPEMTAVLDTGDQNWDTLPWSEGPQSLPPPPEEEPEENS